MERSEKVFLLLIVLYAFFLRIHRLFIPDVIANDGVFYVGCAKLIEKGDFTQFKETCFFNLYPILIYFFHKFLDDWEISGRLVSIVFGTLSVIPLYLLTKTLINIRIGLVLVLFYATLPSVVEFSSDVLREGLFWFLFFSSLYFGIVALLRKRWLFLFLSSFFLVLSLFTRIEGVIVLPLILLYAVYARLKKKTTRKDTLIGFPLSYCAIFSLVFIFTLVLFKFLTSDWELGPLGHKMETVQFSRKLVELKLEEELRSLTSLSSFSHSLVDLALRYRYVLYASEIVYKTLKSLGVLSLAFLVLGILKDDNPLPVGKFFYLFWIIISVLVSYVYVVFYHYFSTRHGLLIGIPLLLWCSKGFYGISSFLENRMVFWKKISQSGRVTPIVLLTLVVTYSLVANLGPSRPDKLEYKQAGICLKEYGLKEKKVVTRPNLARVLFYAEAQPVYLEFVEDPVFIQQHMLREKISFLLIDSKAKTMFEKKRSLHDAGFREISVPCLDSLKKYSFFLFTIPVDPGDR
ncbi:MAG: glycosyltransferase family 39 protein [Deltaproteobacteria bacterium]|nr:glycosyltransferase family 39 protein [Deltaproteobacteria bacterium]